MTQHSGAYNEILYPSYLASQCSPDQLAVMARMKGLHTALPDGCRMLELGCGNGASLLAYGYALPGSEFVGIDLAARPVGIGNAKIEALGLRNVTLHCADVMDVDESYGQFDFIFAHGLFSWVPGPVRERVLEVCRSLLAPNGVAYLSYNAYPGSYQRDMLRAILQIHTRNIGDPAEKIRQSVGLIEFIRSSPFRDTPYHAFFDGVHEYRGKTPPEVLLYDELGSVNQPFFFHEFASLAASHGLQYVNEAVFDQTLPALPPQLKQALDSLGNDVVTFEQYLDFLTGRAFRQTLLCRHGVELDHRRRWEPLRELYFASPVLSQPSKDTDPPGSRRYAGMHGRSAAVSDASVQRALGHLSSVWPSIVPFEELAAAGGGDTGVLGQHLLQFAEANFVKVHAHPFRLASGISEKPRASLLARRQLGERFLANLFCEPVAVTDPLGKLVFARLDGTRNKADLAMELDAVLAAQKPDSDAARQHIDATRADLDEALSKQLKDVYDLGLLEA
jgi:SAM-dependent methyltransferase